MHVSKVLALANENNPGRKEVARQSYHKTGSTRSTFRGFGMLVLMTCAKANRKHAKKGVFENVVMSLVAIKPIPFLDKLSPGGISSSSFAQFGESKSRR